MLAGVLIAFAFSSRTMYIPVATLQLIFVSLRTIHPSSFHASLASIRPSINPSISVPRFYRSGCCSMTVMKSLTLAVWGLFGAEVPPAECVQTCPVKGLIVFGRILELILNPHSAYIAAASLFAAFATVSSTTIASATTVRR